MSNLFPCLVTLLFVFFVADKEVSCDEICKADASRGRELIGSIESRKNETGGWVTTFAAQRESNGPAKSFNMSIKHRYYEHQGKNIIQMEGVITEFPTDIADLLRFHPRCGTNARVINNGRSVEKIRLDEWDNGVTFTNRPLKDEELFEVQLDMKKNGSGDAIGIGVMLHSPNNIKIPNHMNSFGSGNWMMYLANVYKDGSSTKKNFMTNLKEIKVGERIGVKRTASGNLHLFIKGVDQGVAASDVPSGVYGVFELYEAAAKVTIVDQ